MKDFYYNQIQIFIERLNQCIDSADESVVESVKGLIIESVKDLMINKTDKLKDNFKRINECFRILGL